MKLETRKKLPYTIKTLKREICLEREKQAHEARLLYVCVGLEQEELIGFKHIHKFTLPTQRAFRRVYERIEPNAVYLLELHKTNTAHGVTRNAGLSIKRLYAKHERQKKKKQRQKRMTMIVAAFVPLVTKHIS